MLTNYLNPFTIIEWLGVVFTLLYNLFLIRENIWCWLFGILCSVCGMVVFYHTQLYGQMFLYLFYTSMGFYGWWYWKQAEKKHIHIVNWSPTKQVWVFSSGIFACAISYFIVHKMHSDISLLDIELTVFSFIATFKETRKVLSGWLYWVILNLLSAYLYLNNGLMGYFILSLVYSVLSVYGFMAWRKIYLHTKDESNRI
jgi:nicotinamide mononucleotide transporter